MGRFEHVTVGKGREVDCQEYRVHLLRRPRCLLHCMLRADSWLPANNFNEVKAVSTVVLKLLLLVSSVGEN